MYSRIFKLSPERPFALKAQILKVLAAALICSLAGCSDSDNHRSQPVIDPLPEPDPPPEETYWPIANPTVEVAPNIGSAQLVLAPTFDLALVGYQQAEYFLSGTATAYTNTSELGSDGRWAIEAGEQAPYTTRILVYRPTDDADFNGTVIVEWLNVTSGFDTAPDWGTSHVEMTRQGYIWVGVTAQYIGIYGSNSSLAPLHLKATNPARYESLTHPGDSFSYDIYSQVAQSLRSPQGLNPLEGASIERIIAHGESQSAFRMTTYVNAFHPVFNAFDGYMLHVRGAGSSQLSQEPQVAIETPEVVFVRDDINVPVLTFETESEVLGFGFVNARQDDSDKIRLWELAGAAHADLYFTEVGSDDKGDDPSVAAVREAFTIYGVINCASPINAGPHHWVYNAAVAALDSWVRTGEPPPTAPRLLLNDDNSAYQRDELGNVLGGIRTPYVDTPVALLSGSGQGEGGDSFCRLFGSTTLFSAEQMVALYIDEAGYVAAAEEAARNAVDAGFILAADAELILAWAPQQWRSQTGE